MRVFKNFIKVLFRAYWLPMLAYILIFSFISIISTTSSNTNNPEQIFNAERIRVSIIDNDNSSLSKGITNYIDETCTLTELNENDMANLKDVVFYRKSCVILTIPEGFERDLLNNKEPKLDQICLPDSSEGYLVDSFINKYIQFTKLYINQGYDISQAIIEAKDNLSNTVDIKMVDKNKKELAGYVRFYSYLPYPVIAILTLCISAVLISFNKLDIKRRNIISPVSMSSYNSQLLFGSLAVPLIVNFVFIVLSLIMFRTDMLCAQGLIIICNFLVMSFVCLCMSFMISNIAKEKAVSAISTVTSLGLCFLGGVFVPLDMLSKSVKSIAIINPIYWYIKTTELIGSSINLNSEIISQVLYYTLIQLCFAFAFFAISLLVIKQNRVAEN